MRCYALSCTLLASMLLLESHGFLDQVADFEGIVEPNGDLNKEESSVDTEDNGARSVEVAREDLLGLQKDPSEEAKEEKLKRLRAMKSELESLGRVFKKHSEARHKPKHTRSADAEEHEDLKDSGSVVEGIDVDEVIEEAIRNETRAPSATEGLCPHSTEDSDKREDRVGSKLFEKIGKLSKGDPEEAMRGGGSMNVHTVSNGIYKTEQEKREEIEYDYEDEDGDSESVADSPTDEELERFV